MWFPLRFPSCFRPVLALFGVLVWAGSARAVTYPPLTALLYGNSSVNQVGQTSLVTGTGLPYRYFVPKNYNPAVKYPVILFLHGSSEAGTNNTSHLTAGSNTANGALGLISPAGPDFQTSYPCFFVAPQLNPNSNWPNETANFQAILTTLKTYYSIDEDRVCLTGLSLGALGSWEIVNSMPNTFSCMVPMSGGGNTATLNAMPRIPVWVFHGENDANVPCSSSDTTVATLRNRGFPILFTRYRTGEHAIWNVAYQHQQLLPWIFAQRKSRPAMQGVPAINLATTTLGQSPLQITGTAVSTSAIPITRIGWGNSLSGTIPSGSDAATYGDNTVSIPNFTFTAAHVGQRLGIVKVGTSYVATITALVSGDTHKVTVDRSFAALSPRGYFIYPPGDSAYMNPSPGTGAADWSTWSLSVPLNAGASKTQVIMEMDSGNPVLTGSTTLNQAVLLTYAAPTGDTTAPTITLGAPASVPFTTLLDKITLSGTASDNVGVTSVTWTSDSGVGSTGTASGTTSWSAANIPLSLGANTVSVTAKDAKNNFTTRTFIINYVPTGGGLANWKTAKFGASAGDPTIAGNLVDPDGDGIGNLLEYALGGQPLAASPSVLPVLSVAGGGLRLAFTRLSPTDLTYTVEASGDLVTWIPLCTLNSNEVWSIVNNGAVVNETGSGATRNVTVQDTTAYPPASGRRFLRLKVVGP